MGFLSLSGGSTIVDFADILGQNRNGAVACSLRHLWREKRESWKNLPLR